MPRPASARRYARAVFQIALESGDLEGWREDLDTLAMGLQDRELSGLLNAPQVAASRKIDVIGQTLASSVGPTAVNLVSLLAVRRLVHIVPDIVDEYGHLLDAHNGIEWSEVVSAIPLDDGQEARLAELLTAAVAKQVRLSTFVDPQILGGFVARVGDRVIDGSVRARLQQMHREIVEQSS